MEIMDAIYGRRAVRSYSDRVVERHVIDDLLRAAVQAPSAVNHQPWAFAVVQDPSLLDSISARAKQAMLAVIGETPRTAEHRFALEMLRDPAFDMFYNASTLVVICAKPGGPGNVEDCCLAAQNLMLAAHAAGLGTCPIGFARPWLNTPEAKRELGMPSDYEVVMPLILGYPAGPTAPTPRDKPVVVSWREAVPTVKQ